MRLACVRRLAHAGASAPSGKPLTLCQPAHKYTVGQAPLLPWCHFTGEIIVCGVRWYLHSAGHGARRECEGAKAHPTLKSLHERALSSSVLCYTGAKDTGKRGWMMWLYS